MNDAPADLKKKAISEMEEAMRKLAVWSNGGMLYMYVHTCVEAMRKVADWSNGGMLYMYVYTCIETKRKLDMYVFRYACVCVCVCVRA